MWVLCVCVCARVYMSEFENSIFILYFYFMLINQVIYLKKCMKSLGNNTWTCVRCVCIFVCVYMIEFLNFIFILYFYFRLIKQFIYFQNSFIFFFHSLENNIYTCVCVCVFVSVYVYMSKFENLIFILYSFILH